MASIYDLKPRFQGMLRPVARWLVAAGVTANGVTLFALLLSFAHGAWLAVEPGAALALVLLPVTLFLRMAANAIDGMMAREHGQANKLGALLNELSDVASDAALYLPFALIAGLSGSLVVLVVVTGIIGEMAGALGLMVGAARHYEGPLGKSDRAFAFGLLALLLAIALPPGLWLSLYLGVMLALAVLTLLNRMRAILGEDGAAE